MRQKRVTKEDYIELFCQEKRIRKRRVIYVSEETHKKLKNIAFLFQVEEFTTSSSLADAILTHHMKLHKDLLNDLYRQQKERILTTSDEDQDDNESD